MKFSDIAHARLASHRLSTKKCATPGEVVAWLGAAQAQDFAAAKWSVGLRVRRATDTDVERAFNDGAILRAHVMRPTWHFVTPQDVHALIALTASRVQASNARGYRMLELDRAVFSRCRAVLTRALSGGTHLTRSELADRLRRSRIEAAGQRLAYILMHAELEGLICSGPRRGKQLTYALLDERVPPGRPMDREAALAWLTERYFTSHGPAQVGDFAWWSGLSVRDVRRGLEMAGSGLAREEIDGKTYWWSREAGLPKRQGPAALLLSIFDEYTIAYQDRRAIAGGRSLESMLSSGAALTAVLILNGKVAGTWKRVITRGRVEIRIAPFRRLGRSERDAVQAAAEGYAAFLGIPDAAVTLGQLSPSLTAQIRRPL